MGDFVALETAKAWLGIADTSSDALLGVVIPSVTQAMLDYMDRDPRETTVTERHDGTNNDTLVVNQYPVSAVSAITVDDTPLDATQLARVMFDGRFIYWRGGFFPRGPKNISISLTGGIPAADTAALAALQMAALHTLKAMWSARRMEQNATGESFSGVLSQSFWATGPGAVPPAAKTLMANYVRVLVAP